MSPRRLVDRQFFGEDATGLHKVDHARLCGTSPGTMAMERLDLDSTGSVNLRLLGRPSPLPKAPELKEKKSGLYDEDISDGVDDDDNDSNKNFLFLFFFYIFLAIRLTQKQHRRSRTSPLQDALHNLPSPTLFANFPSSSICMCSNV